MSSLPKMPISEFKATCLQVLERVRRTRHGLLVTKRGEVVAEIRPPTSGPAVNWRGAMADSVLSMGDLISPVISMDAFEVAGKAVLPKKRRPKARRK